MTSVRRGGPFLAVVLALVGCQGGGGDMLSRIEANGTIRVATDPAYPPQSELLPDGTFEGFDIDVANEIGERLGVDVEFVTPEFAEVEVGGWADRWDVSVGSMTVTAVREEVLDFTQAYYFTPAQMGATVESGITDLADLSGQTVCTGESTTYQFWLEGTLELSGGVPEPSVPPEDVTVTTFGTDTECSDSVEAGRTDFQAWLTAGPTLKLAIADGVPFVEIGDPVFFEALAVAIDKQSPLHDELLAEIDRIIGEMHEDGTLTEFSKKWFDGLDYSVTQ